ncbi:glycoside hydrolase family 32 protein [Kribbella sp. NBC_00889]|uniref:glycoside hydrolase family 32 protein n=1 Tax=Kribbella sp. NBC_00889 TaxID=2975974 RepID=UPI00386F1385|nr:glycoside hydrolase family 32 protein [Kribbella sp. NBC_00889]
MTDYQEDNRGRFHFSPRRGWMNDPNGMLHYRGSYHFYFQHAPNSLVWDTMHWGHATSPDMVHWEQQPIALDPAVHPGELWSGGGLVDVRNTSGLKDGDHDPIAVFTGTQGVRMFYSLDGGMTFTAYDEGRVIAQPSGHESRDPKVVWHEPSQTWAMVVWSDDNGNGADFFVSPDLRTWERSDRYVADWLFECPDFTPMMLDGVVTWVLRDGRGSYVVGDFDGREFRTDWTEPCTITVNPGGAGGQYYAAQSFDNMPDDRVVTMAWQGLNRGSVWTGNASFPVQQRLVATPDGPRVFSQPVDEIASLRTSATSYEAQLVTPGAPLLTDVDATSYELEATFDVSGAVDGSFAFRLRTGADGSSAREVTYDVGAGALDGVPLSPAADGILTVRLLVDRGQLAIFAADGAYYACYNVDFDTTSTGNGLQLTTTAPLNLTSLTLHHLSSIWPTSG